MATGLGINYMPDPNKSGNFIGRSPLDERKVNAALRTQGVLSGCGITLSAGAMTYSVGEGVVQMSRGAADGAVIAYVPARTLTVAATTGQARIDIIYAAQNDYEQGDPDNLATFNVKEGTPAGTPSAPSLSAGQQEVARFLVPANTSKSNGATAVGSTTYSIPYGGSLGILAMAQDTNKGSYGTVAKDWLVVDFYIPTDRMIELSIDTCMRLGEGNAAQLGYKPKLDGVPLAHFDGPLLTANAFESSHFSLFVVAQAGRRVVALNYGRENGDGVPYGVYAPNGRQGTTLRIIDRGVSW